MFLALREKASYRAVALIDSTVHVAYLNAPIHPWNVIIAISKFYLQCIESISVTTELQIFPISEPLFQHELTGQSASTKPNPKSTSHPMIALKPITNPIPNTNAHQLSTQHLFQHPYSPLLIFPPSPQTPSPSLTSSPPLQSYPHSPVPLPSHP